MQQKHGGPFQYFHSNYANQNAISTLSNFIKTMPFFGFQNGMKYFILRLDKLATCKDVQPHTPKTDKPD